VPTGDELGNAYFHLHSVPRRFVRAGVIRSAAGIVGLTENRFSGDITIDG
jgi:hypothetical protein